MKKTDKHKEWLEKTPGFDDDIIERLQDPKFESGWLELTLQEFLEDGNVDTFIRCLTYIVKARGRGEVSRLANASNVDRSNLSDVLNGKSTLRIDTALKLIRGLGYECNIRLKSA